MPDHEADARDAAVRDPIPADPLPHVARWIEDASEQSGQSNPDAIALATAADDGPDVRMVLARGFDPEHGFLVFYTDRGSSKGRALAARPVASAVFFWDALQRQIRVRGPITCSPESESDRYFARRPRASQLAATASRQSRPIASRAALLACIARVERQYPEGRPIPRPPHWGGYRLWFRSVELWAGSPGRAHDRARWTRSLVPHAEGFAAGPWHGQRLQP